MVRSCASCQFRKVKCIRGSEDHPCTQCVKQQLDCVLPAKKPRKPYKPRNGQRIEAFRAAQQSGSILSPQDRIIHVDAPQVILSADSPNERLARTEESDAFLFSLVDVYFSMLPCAAPVGRWNQLRAQFDLAGRRPIQIKDSTTEILVRCAAVHGAMITDCPALVGSDAPALKNFEMVKGQDLSSYGHRRAPVVAKLLHDALARVESRGILRDASSDAVSVLIVCVEMESYVRSGFAHRPFSEYPGSLYVHAAVQIIKQCTVANPTTTMFQQDQMGGSAWIAVGLDAISNAWAADRPSITDKQLSLFLGPVSLLDRMPCMTATDVQNIAVSDHSISMLTPSVRRLWFDIYNLVRKLASDVSYPLAWEDDFPEADVHAILDTVETMVQSGSSTDLARAMQNQRKRPQGVQRHLIAAAPTAFSVLPVLEKRIGEFKKRLLGRKVSSFSGKAEDDVLLKIQAAEAKLDKLRLQCGRQIVATITARGLQGLIMFDPTCLLGYTPAYWGKVLLEAPCSFEGGPANYSYLDKLQEVRHLIDILKIQSWTWPERGHDAEELEELLFNFETSYAYLVPPLANQAHAPTTSAADLLVHPQMPDGVPDAPSVPMSDLALSDLWSGHQLSFLSTCLPNESDQGVDLFLSAYQGAPTPVLAPMPSGAAPDEFVSPFFQADASAPPPNLNFEWQPPFD